MFDELKPHLPPVGSRHNLRFTASYISDDFGRISTGFDSSGMDQKWDIIFKEPWLYFHRSWTGKACYGVRFDSVGQMAIVAESWINRDVYECDEESLSYNRKLLGFLIDIFLLRKAAEFPWPPRISGTRLECLAYFHMIVGHTPPTTARE